MYDIDLNRYTEVVDSAIALRPQIEKAVDEICAQGYSNLFFIGCGGTYAHSLPMMYWLESTTNKVEAHAVIAAEFMVMGHKAFSKDSVCIFSTRSGNTKEIVAAAKFCKEAGARTMVYVSNDNTPVCEYADYKFYSPAEDPDLCEAIYSYTICLLGRFMKNAGAFDKYDEFMAQYAGLTKYLIAGKEKFDPFCQELAKKFKNVDYHMVIGGGMLWGEAYDYAMCILEEMQWIRTKSIHVCEYFHGPLELVEKGLVTDQVVLTVGYDIENLTDPAHRAAYSGPVEQDRYGRRVPKAAHGAQKLDAPSSSTRRIMEAASALFDRIVDGGLLVRRMYLVAAHIVPEDEAQPEEMEQLDLFTDLATEDARREAEQAAQAREKKLQETTLAIKKKFGKNAILKGMSLEEGATARERNARIGGHKA